MKRTISKLLSIAALTITTFSTALLSTPANAAYVAPFVPATGCSGPNQGIQTSASFPYPHRLTSAPTTTGWFVYCGTDATDRYRYDSGENFRMLTNGPTPPPNAQLREKFQANNIVLYVFTDVNQAKAALGTTNVPPAAEANGVVGYTKMAPVSPIPSGIAGIVMMFENPKNSSGVPTAIPTTPANLIYNYREVLSHESGHVIDWLAANASTPFGSNSAGYHTIVAGDITRFNARNGCALSGPDSNLWNSTIKTQICNGAGARNATYPTSTWPNLRVVKDIVGSGIGTGFTQYFTSTPTYVELFPQTIAITRTGGSSPAFTTTNDWISLVYKCTRQYGNRVYQFFDTAYGTCP